MSKRKILIVDDSELNRAIVAELFRGEYDVVEAENGDEAVSCIEKYYNDIAVILLDIIMPVKNGFEVMDIMNKRFWIGHIPVVMVTTDTSEEAMEKGYKLGASDVITKPFNPRIVRQRVKNVIELYTHKRNLEQLAGSQLDVLRTKSESVLKSNDDIVKLLSKVIELKAGKSAPRSDEVCRITAAVLREYGRKHPDMCITGDYIDNVSSAAEIYDIGKIFIPESILNKPSALSPDEYEIIKKHASDGADFIGHISDSCKSPLLNLCREICGNHHEREDGKGYPHGLKESEISLPVKAVAISSVYDALVSGRPYRKAFTHKEAVEMIKSGECGYFGEDILDAFTAAEDAINPAVPQKKSIRTEEDSDNAARVLRLLEKERSRYLILSDMSGDIIVDYECDTNTVSISDGFTVLTGLKNKYDDAKAFINETKALFDDDRKHIKEIIAALSADEPTAKSEVRIRLQNGTYKWFEMYLHSTWGDEYCLSIVGKLVNIDRQKRESEQWRKAADTDPLTGIYNKLAIENCVVDALNSPGEDMSALCFVDLDNFKRINDTYGHQFGDMVLKKVADQLRSTVRGSDIVGRVGGDEFVVFLRGIGTRKNISAKAELLCRVFKMSCGECKISGSIGIACYPDDGLTYAELLNKADQALYACKGTGKDSFLFYDEEYSDKPYTSLLSDPESSTER